MPYHVYIHSEPEQAEGQPRRERRRLSENYYWVNLDAEALQTRIVQPYDAGDALSWSGQSVEAVEIATIQVWETDESAQESVGGGDRYQFMQTGRNVTNEVVTGPPGRLRAQHLASEIAPSRKDPQRVMVVHGRNLAARNAVFTFLRSLGLAPIEWEEAVAETGIGSPYNLEAVQAAMEVAQAVVVVITAEDQAGLHPSLADSPDSPETVLEGQPRQNVMFEAGMAIGTGRATTILVEIGRVRSASDFHGLNVVRLTNNAQRRAALRNRLINVGCAVNETTQDWLAPETGGDFEAAPIIWQPQSPGGLAATFAIPTTDMRGGHRVELNLRTYQLPDDAAVVCVVTPPGAPSVESQPEGNPAGENQHLFATVYPDEFEHAGVVAGHHAVEWLALIGDQRRQLAVTEFRYA